MQAGLVSEDEREIIEYGITQGFFLMINLLVFIAICGYFQIITMGIVFMLFFWPMRIYAGGYHANSRVRCIVLSIFIEVGICTIICKVPIGIIPILFAVIIAWCIIYKFAPVDTEERRLNIQERVAFRKIVHKQLLTESFLLLIASFMKLQLLCKVIVTAMSLVALLLLLEKVKQYMPG